MSSTPSAAPSDEHAKILIDRMPAALKTILDGRDLMGRCYITGLPLPADPVAVHLTTTNRNLAEGDLKQALAALQLSESAAQEIEKAIRERVTADTHHSAATGGLFRADGLVCEIPDLKPTHEPCAEPRVVSQYMPVDPEATQLAEAFSDTAIVGVCLALKGIPDERVEHLTAKINAVVTAKWLAVAAAEGIIRCDGFDVAKAPTRFRVDPTARASRRLH